ncbi:MAG: hypothetical protein AYK23_00105 [Candidatus Proteinoplasmatales archaeon SG8-5]|nr:MAG: hypothetical protein AYK23_00105 [Candidatus Proteinoplasmatales archaeon SG8-5]
MKTLSIAFITWLVVLGALSLPLNQSSNAQQTIGWQYETFGENLEMTITPEIPTTEDPIMVEVVSIFPDVYVQVANFYARVTPNNGHEFQFQTIFQRWNNSAMRVSVGPFPYNGYTISMYVIAYDWLNIPMDSRDTFNYIEFEVGGSGWKHDTFDANVEVEYSPMTVNATEEVTVTISSKDNITFGGANLWWTYETPEGDLIEGVGENFTKVNPEVTVMKQTIPGYPPGTNLTFWVVAWDTYNEVMVSKEYNYSVLGLVQYTDFPFIYTDDDDRSEWEPDFSILAPMVILCAVGVPLYLYLYVLTRKREGRRETLVMSNDSQAAAPEEKEEGDEDGD